MPKNHMRLPIRWKWILVFCIFLGIFFRFFNAYENVNFTWDQENSVAYPAWEIIHNHKLPLIGARTGIGELRLAPLYSYLAVPFFMILKLNPIAASYLAGFIFLLTLIIEYIFISKYFLKTTAIWYVFLWTVSTFLTSFDRIPWNVNLLPLSVLLIIIGQKQIDQKQLSGWIYQGVGIFLAINSHYSFILLIITVIIYNLIRKSFWSKSALWFSAGIFLGILPLAIFNFRHQNILIVNLIDFSKTNSQILFISIAFKFIKIFGLIFETLGRIFFYNGESWIQQFVGLSLTISTFYFNKKHRNLILFFIVLVFCNVIVFSFYKNSVPDYYLLNLIPVFLIILSLSLSQNKKIHNLIFYLIILLGICNIFNTYKLTKVVGNESLYIKEKLVKFIKNNSSTTSIGINFDTDMPVNFGFNYLFDYFGLKINIQPPPDQVFWISQPISRFPLTPDFIAGNYAVGNPQTTKIILTTQGTNFFNNLFSARIPQDWIITNCHINNQETYLLSANKNVSCNSIINQESGILLTEIKKCDQLTKLNTKLNLNSNNLPNLVLNNDNNLFNLYKSNLLLAWEVQQNRCILMAEIGKKDPIKNISKDFQIFIQSLKKN